MYRYNRFDSTRKAYPLFEKLLANVTARAIRINGFGLEGNQPAQRLTDPPDLKNYVLNLHVTESPSRAKFIRKGSPDAGVECFCVMPDGSEWGWQAKYFGTLGPSQWSQLDESVKTALDRHSSLVRYYICTPLDRPDSRVHNQKSALERWNDHVQKWQSLGARPPNERRIHLVGFLRTN